MSYKNYRAFYMLLIRIFIVVAVVGVVVLLYAGLHDNPSNVAFSLIAFIISVAALVMTTLQSLSIARQVQLAQRSARLVAQATDRLEQLVVQDGRLEKEIAKDLEFDRAIVAVLEEYGIGDDHVVRAQVAQKIAQAVGETTLRKERVNS